MLQSTEANRTAEFQSTLQLQETNSTSWKLQCYCLGLAFTEKNVQALTILRKKRPEPCD